MSRRVYAETSVLLSYMLETPGRIGTIEAVLREASSGDPELFTSVVSIVEIAYLTNSTGASSRGTLSSTGSDQQPDYRRGEHLHPARRVWRVTSSVTERWQTGVELSRRQRPGARHTPSATAVWIDAVEFWTYDEDISKYQEAVGDRTKICAPNTLNPMLEL
ncbi:MAG: hypothetical protein R2839_10370 [Thermomicrobiales bacterium]